MATKVQTTDFSAQKQEAVVVDEVKQDEVKQDAAAKTVTVFVPKAFRFTDDLHQVHEIRAGMQEMLESRVDHWWCKVNGVKRYIPEAQ